MTVEIRTPRFVMRELTVVDANERYLGWLRDEQARRYIDAASATRDLDDLRGYVASRVNREDVLFLGIFDGETGAHIGNIKYEPVDARSRYAVMGVLIGEPSYRGRGVTSEVLAASCDWLRANRLITQVVLGVSEDNVGAIRAYEKAGFRMEATPHISKPAPGSVTMVRDQ